jgi:uncharacterized membrane protein
MDPEPSAVTNRLADLEQRLRRIEQRLEMEQPAPMPATAVPVVVEAVAAPPDDTGSLERFRPHDPVSAAKVQPWRSKKEPAAAARSPMDLERMIGTRWFAAAGAVVVVIGIGLFLKLAYDQGWLNRLPPAGKCLAGAGFGAALLAGGEVIRRRLGPLASAGVSAAGLGALFASVYAAHGVYHLIGAAPAFMLLGAVSLLGFGVAAVGRLVSVAVLSLVAAYVSPMVIGPPVGAPLMLPAYLLALLCLGLALSAWRAAPFRILRGLVWWGTLIYGGLWTVDEGMAHPRGAIAFLAACWAGLHVELGVSARRARREPEPGAIPELPWPSVRFIATSFSTTAWAVALAVNLLMRATTLGGWVAPAVATGVVAVVAGALAGRLRVLRDVPRTDSERLGAGLAMQAGGLLMTALALGLSGWMESAAWLSLGVAAIGAGRWIRSRGLDVYGLVALAIATARLIVVDSSLGARPEFVAGFMGLVITRWTLVMVLGAGAWAVGGALLRRGEGETGAVWRSLRHGALVAAMAHLSLSLVTPGADGGSVAVAWLVLGIAGLVIGAGLRSGAMAVYGVVMLVGATARFVAGAPELGAAAPVLASWQGLVLTRWTVLMLIGAAAWFVSAVLVGGRGEGEGPIPERAGLVGVGLAMVYAAATDPRVEAAALSMAWLGIGALAVLTHRLVRRAALDAGGLLGIGLSAVAWCAAYPMAWMERHAAPGTHPGLLASVVIAGVGIGAAAWARRSRPTSRELLTGVVPGAIALLFASTSLEVARSAGILAHDPAVRRAAVSIWWGLVAVGLVAAGFIRRSAPARHVGLALLAVATAKAFLYDLREVPTLWRVVTFIGLGLLMLGVAVGYAKAAALWRRPDGRAEEKPA